MKLYLLRHADAEPKKPKAEGERELTATGRQQAQRLAVWVKRHDIRFGAIMVSPRLRAFQTTEPLACAGQSEVIQDQRLAGGELDVEALDDIVTELERPDSLLIVGHEPDMSNTVEQLTGGAVVFGPATLALVECERVGAGGGELVWLFPDELRQ